LQKQCTMHFRACASVLSSNDITRQYLSSYTMPVIGRAASYEQIFQPCGAPIHDCYVPHFQRPEEASKAHRTDYMPVRRVDKHAGV